VAAVKAITAARMAVRGDGTHHVSLDKAVKTMRETGADMKDKYKETPARPISTVVRQRPTPQGAHRDAPNRISARSRNTRRLEHPHHRRLNGPAATPATQGTRRRSSGTPMHVTPEEPHPFRLDSPRGASWKLCQASGCESRPGRYRSAG
jgi:hypothetical protein